MGKSPWSWMKEITTVDNGWGHTRESLPFIVNSTVIVTGIFQFSMVNFTLANFHYYGGKNR